jgi:hypothetical protein
MLAGMTKRSVPNVVSKRARLNQPSIEPKANTDGGSELKHFDTVGESLSQIIVVLNRE